MFDRNDQLFIALWISFGVTPQIFNIVGVHAVGTLVFHRVAHCLMLVSQIYNVIEIATMKINDL